jgi:hypothetical protein
MFLTFEQKKSYLYHENQRRFYSADAARGFEGLWKGLSVEGIVGGVRVPDSPLF